MSQPDSIDFSWSQPDNIDKPTQQPMAAPGSFAQSNQNVNVGDELSDLFSDFGIDTIKPAQPTSNQQPSETLTATKPPLTLKITDKKTLYSMWMPIFKFGGLFIPKDQLANKEYAVGETLSFRISLPDDPAVLSLVGVKMAWETPRFAENRLIAGIGFAFESSEIATILKQRAERLLIDVPPSLSNYTI